MSGQHTKLSQEEVIQIYNKEFREEYDAVVANIRNVSKGNTSFSNTWKEWLGIGSISASVVVINALLATLVALALVSGFVSLGVGLAVAVTGVIGGIAFQKHRINKNKKKYQDAEAFIESEMTPDNQEKLREKLQKQLFPILKECAPEQINFIIKAVMAALENLIINKQVTGFVDFDNRDIELLLLASTQKTPVVTLNTKLIQSVIARLASARNSHEVVERHVNDMRDVHSDYQALHRVNSMWLRQSVSGRVQEEAIAREFESNTIKLQ